MAGQRAGGGRTEGLEVNWGEKRLSSNGAMAKNGEMREGEEEEEEGEDVRH